MRTIREGPGVRTGTMLLIETTTMQLRPSVLSPNVSSRCSDSMSNRMINTVTMCREISGNRSPAHRSSSGPGNQALVISTRPDRTTNIYVDTKAGPIKTNTREEGDKI